MTTTATGYAAGALRLLGTHHQPRRHHHHSGAHTGGAQHQSVLDGMRSSTSSWPFVHYLAGPAGPVIFISALILLAAIFLLTKHPVIFGGMVTGVLLLDMGVTPIWAKTTETGRGLCAVFAVAMGVGAWWVSDKIRARIQAHLDERRKRREARAADRAKDTAGRFSLKRGRAAGRGAQPADMADMLPAVAGAVYEDHSHN